MRVLLVLTFTIIAFSNVANAGVTRYFDSETEELIYESEAAGIKHTIVTYDDNNAILSITHLDENGEPINNLLEGTDTHKLTFEFNEDGNEVKCEIYQLDDKNDSGVKLVLRIEYFYDKEGNLIREDQIPVNYVLYGFITRTEYDMSGNKISEAYYEQDGETRTGCKIYLHRIEWEYDNNGNVISERYLEPELKPVRLIIEPGEITVGKNKMNCKDVFPRGAYSIRMDYNDIGNVISVNYLNKEGEAVTTANAVYRVEWSYDESGEVISERHFDVSGEIREVSLDEVTTEKTEE